MTTSEALEVFGSSIPFQYFNGEDYVESQFLYDSTSTITGAPGRDFLASGSNFLVYTASCSDLVANRDYITVDISPGYSIFNTSQIHTCIALSMGSSKSSSTGVSTSFQSPTWEWYIGGERYLFENSYSSSGTWVMLKLTDVPTKFTYVPADFDSESITSGYSVRAVFSGNKAYNGVMYLAIACPYVSEDASGVHGTSPGTSEPGTTPGGTDMTETNGILSRIWSAIISIPQAIIDGIASIFIPEEGFIESNFQRIREHFSWYEQIQAVGETFRTAFSANQFNDDPVVIIGSAHSAWTGGTYFSDGTFVLDMTDFAPYRDTVRTIIRIFLWLFFFWRLYARLPDILSGAGMVSGDTIRTIDHSRDKDS